ncbi:bifunctional UDP-N-acetylmuramoyl-tripeptide:D-alanyl-D-alanine ligase/alanine racemase [Kaistella daneshvariae]|uniref:Alanine racemase n=1 Tax=Kaistella daneshvariae TaxID=2487074 RepID=A0ABM7C7N7_9FLAO|nr:bifunctional UDP-N-acetylmuramoyl-tripeptide:D-alanyl-D-alanine ligase/alanine racemase [Kaistella daneshvariae]AZI66989.1 bifunctional UDP-N-acetylmuramoyl-tripeptide:D-alanyl-D-alanine ligase/alanine racemase [Kaistella daneshvariae]
MNYTAKEIAEITGSKLIGNPDVTIKNIAYDSRNIYSVADTAFVAITTAKNSGEKYIHSVIEKGIMVIIAENYLPQFSDVTWIIVENSLLFLQNFAKYHLQQFPSLKTIGITGSNGKTIVKEWLYQSLFHDFTTVKSPKSFNSQLGLPLSLLEIKPKHQLGIFEVGISKPGEMEILEHIFSPEIGILTYIGTAHSVNFEDINEIISEKIKLFQHSELIIFNGDNPAVKSAIEEKYPAKRLFSFGFQNQNDLHIVGDWTDRSQEISVSYLGEKFAFPVSQRDEATISNVLCVIAVLKEFNFSNAQIIARLNTLKAVEMRLESVVGVRNNLIINDSFNLDVDSLKIAYQNINEYNKPQKCLILTDFVEGKNSAELYQEVAALTNQQNFDQIFLVGSEITQHEGLFKSETHTFGTTQELIDSQQLNSVENHLILLKGARKFEIERTKTFLELQKHDTVLEINLNSILHNINVHKSLLKPETKMMAMVKAYSYGLGGYEIAEFLQHHHIDYLGVAYADEGIDLRKNGITTPIMVMNPEQHSYNSIIDFNLEPEIYSFRVLDLFNEKLLEKGIMQTYPIHIKMETGMHRLGFKTEELPELISKLQGMNVKVKSVFSHLSSADDENENAYTLEQVGIFEKNAGFLAKNLGYQPIRHILNSTGIVNFPQYQFEMVRIGIGMVGISGDAEISKRLKSAVTFKTVVSQISEVKKGESVGYNRKFKAEKDTKIATIPVGYADGIPRLLGNKVGVVGIQNSIYPIVGNVCMDMLMVDIGSSAIKEGEEVILFNSCPTLEQFAHSCSTIPYEVLTSISRRVKRIYIKD